MIRVIGGPARCGKSTLARALHERSEIPLTVTMLDHVLHGLTEIAGEANRANLLLAPGVNEFSVDEWLEQLRRRDRVLWNATRGMIGSALRKKDNVIFEGGLWPDHVVELGDFNDVRTVFLVDTSDHADRLIELAGNPDTQNNWMSNWPSEKIRKWAGYNAVRGQTVYELAIRCCFPVYDIGVLGLQRAQDCALADLMA